MSVNNVEKEGSCVLPSNSTLDHFVMLFLTALGNPMKDVWSVGQLRVVSHMNDCVDTLLDVQIFGDGSMCQAAINSTIKARAPVVQGIVLVNC